MPVTEQTAITSLEQLIERNPELQDLGAELGRCETRREEVMADVGNHVARQHELRQRLASAGTKTERTKTRAELATTAAEATVMPDEATVTNEAFALALHRWASTCIDKVEELRAEARREERATYDSARAAHEKAEAEERPTKPLRFKEAAAGWRLQRRDRELDKVRRTIGDACQPVFPYRPDGKLEGHQRWVAQQRAQVEEQLRA